MPENEISPMEQQRRDLEATRRERLVAESHDEEQLRRHDAGAAGRAEQIRRQQGERTIQATVPCSECGGDGLAEGEVHDCAACFGLGQTLSVLTLSELKALLTEEVL